MKVWFAPIDCKDFNYRPIMTEDYSEEARTFLKPICEEYLRKVADVQREIAAKYNLDLEYPVREKAEYYT